tara:strand:+ start:10753 stop:11100 length:348 start_codon:yes stop_codon:yes gene_type:complete
MNSDQFQFENVQENADPFRPSENFKRKWITEEGNNTISLSNFLKKIMNGSSTVSSVFFSLITFVCSFILLILIQPPYIVDDHTHSILLSRVAFLSLLCGLFVGGISIYLNKYYKT